MNLPFTLPDWLPAWAFLLLALPALLYLFVFLLMPFSVFGLKARLEALESQLEAVHDDLRALSRGGIGGLVRPRLDEDFDVPNFGQLKSAQAQNAYVEPALRQEPLPAAINRPAEPVPVPITARRDARAAAPRPDARAAAPRPGRMEPRLD